MRRVAPVVARDPIPFVECVSDVTARRIATNLIRGREVDARSIIRTLVEVEVVLELTAELDKVITRQLCQVIAEEVILAVPDTSTDVLCIHVVRRKYGRRSSRRGVQSHRSRLQPEPERSRPSTARSCAGSCSGNRW